AIHAVFQQSWKEGKVPAKWKKAEVKFLRKNGKKSYHDPGAYRPISLTSYLCKCLERIITYRLYGFSEHFSLLDKEQGFRKFRGTPDALLRITQDICNSFNVKEHTAALFVDIEKAYVMAVFGRMD
ncbi:MAG: reverse transcriptase domain-containing protein, partial [Candidatus Thiodiazotropha endolucinida]|nr:reverse transcriptase domain-containing protein [Candidatus Thiodiazotropha endolucinida]